MKHQDRNAHLALAAEVSLKDAIRDTDHSVAPRRFKATITAGIGRSTTVELNASTISEATAEASSLLVGPGIVTVERTS